VLDTYRRKKAVDDACIIVPAFEAARTVGSVIDDLQSRVGLPLIVVDDGSSDATSEVARRRGATVLRHRHNRGKGAALRTGLSEAERRGFRVAVTADSDGQHPAQSARAVLEGSDDERVLVLGVRDLARDGAPASNRFGNAVSNFFLSTFSGAALSDTQCGLRRYPVSETLALGARADGYAFEGEVVLRAVNAGWRLVEVPVRVIYPAAGLGQTHFRRFVDPPRIVATVVRTVVELRLRG
jgi:glycosyltransferase involved in cell wall biosynthesis